MALHDLVAVLYLGLWLSGVEVLSPCLCQEVLTFEISVETVIPPQFCWVQSRGIWEPQLGWPRKAVMEWREQEPVTWGGTRQGALRSPWGTSGPMHSGPLMGGSSDKLWIAFGIILTLSWTIAPGFCWDGWLISLSNGHMATHLFLSRTGFPILFYNKIGWKISKSLSSASLLINNSIFKLFLSSHILL